MAKPSKRAKPTDNTPGKSRFAHARIIRIHNAIHSGTFPNANKLARELNVCVRTIRRDMEFMKETFDLPIAYNELRYGFYYNKEVKQFPTVKLTTGELIALCLTRQLMDSLRGTPFEPQLRSALEKITHGMQEEISFRWDELAAAVSFRSNGGEVQTDPETLSLLTTMVVEGHEVEFKYTKAGSRKPELRRVQPLHLTWMENAWYLLSYDLRRKQYRTFVLSRMSNVLRTGRVFEKPEDFNPQELLKNSIGIFKGGEPERVRLHARGMAALLIKERSWHPSQQVKTLSGREGAEVEVTLTIAITPDLDRWIFSWAGEVQVLEPEPLRERIRAKAKEMAEAA